MTMTAKRRQAIEAGGRVFMQHGFARTTMGMIAETAGMSRPALYLLFNGKEEVLKAVVDTWTEQLLTNMRAEISESTDLGDKLRKVCAMWSVAAFERSQNNPEVRDLIGHPAYEDGYACFISFIAEILDTSAKPATRPISSTELARSLVLGIRGYKVSASDMDDFLHLIEVQVSIIEVYLKN